MSIIDCGYQRGAGAMAFALGTPRARCARPSLGNLYRPALVTRGTDQAVDRDFQHGWMGYLGYMYIVYIYIYIHRESIHGFYIVSI